MAAPIQKPISILVVEEHPLVRFGWRLLFASHPEYVLVGTATNHEEALSYAASEQPDIILLDLLQSDDTVLDFLPELLATAGPARVVVLTNPNDSEIQRRALSLGARGLILKDHVLSLLFKAIERVHAGEVWIDPEAVAGIAALNAPARQPPDSEAAKIATLTSREREIIPLVCEGLRNQEIAERVRFSEGTVRHYLNRIYRKLDVRGRNHLCAYARRHNLDKPSS